jgi:hypothetical protein
MAFFFVERYAVEEVERFAVEGLKKVTKSVHVSGMDRQWTDYGPTMDRQWTDYHPRKKSRKTALRAQSRKNVRRGGLKDNLFIGCIFQKLLVPLYPINIKGME